MNGKKVIVTPLRAHQYIQKNPQDLVQQRPSERVIQKVLLKAVTWNRKNPKMFTLRSINTTAITSCDNLKRVIKEQLKQEIVSDIRVFDVGFVQGSNVVSIRSAEDLQEVFMQGHVMV